MLREVMRLKCRFTYPAISQALRQITGEEDWMGFKSNGEDPIRNFRSYVQKGLIEKDGNEVVILWICRIHWMMDSRLLRL